MWIGGSIHLPITSELKQIRESRDLIFCPQLCSLAQKRFICWFVFQNLHFINSFKSLSSNVSFMQFIILTLSWRASFFKQAAAGWVLDNWLKKKKIIHYSDILFTWQGFWSFPLALYSHLLLGWKTCCRGFKTSTWAVLLQEKRTKSMVLKRCFLHTYQNITLC